jgi:hypothetical protein
MNDVVGLTILAATAVIPVAVARAVLGAVLAQMTRVQTAQLSITLTTNQPVGAPRPVPVPAVSLEAR